MTDERVPGGPASRRRLAALVGLAPGGPFRVSRVIWDGARLELAVAASGGAGAAGAEPAEVAVLYLAATAPGTQALLRSAHLSLSHRGASLPQAVEALVRAGAFAADPEVTLEALGQELVEERARIEQERGGEPSGRRRGSAGRLGADAPWADFLGWEDIPDQKVISMWLRNPCPVVLHGDSECFGPPNLGVDVMMTACLPWDDRVRDRGRPAPRMARVRVPDTSALAFHVTDVRDADVISGSRERERQVVDHVLGAGPERVILFHGCVGVVSGSDIEDVCAAESDARRLPILPFRGGENRHLDDFYRRLLEDERLGTPHPADAPAARLNLVGFSACATVELVEALEGIGAQINAILLPQLDPEDLRRFELAGTSVYLPTYELAPYYQQLRLRTGIERHVVPRPPYGFAGTETFLREVAESVGLRGDVEAYLRRLAAPLEARARDLAARAGRLRLGLVGRASALSDLVDASPAWGVPLMPTLLDLGFGLDVLLHCEDPAEEAAARAALEKKGARAEVSLSFFRDLPGMLDALRSSECAAVFSGFSFDWRASSAGKPTFSLQVFEPGFEGALRTTERLLQTCETSFYARYGRHLQRDDLGRRRRAP